MAKEDKAPARIIYKRDSDLSKVGFADYAEAAELHHTLSQKYAEPGYRIRTRMRSRTGTWDVVVKVRTEVAV